MDGGKRGQIFACLGLALLAATATGAQSFGTLVFKDKVTLMRKLPAAVHLTGTTIKVKVTLPAVVTVDLRIVAPHSVVNRRTCS